MLLAVEQSAAPRESQRTTYIFDRDLVRFAKFTGAVLAMFLVVGAYLFGFKLELALEKLRDAQEAIKTNTASMATARLELEKAQATVKTLKDDVEKVLGEARKSVGEISDQKRQAIAILTSMKALTESQKTALNEERNKSPTEFRPAEDPFSKTLWPVGKSLSIRFLTGDDATRKKVQNIATEWTRFANITFAFGDDNNAPVRIELTTPGGSWSYVGTDALVISPDEATMTLGILGSSVTDDEFRMSVLHEFGHLLGLIHETQNPNAKIPWNQAAVLRVYSKPPNSWPKELIEEQFFSKTNIPPESYRPFDALSIMWYQIPKEFLTEPIQQRTKPELSESDKTFISKLYPR